MGNKTIITREVRIYECPTCGKRVRNLVNHISFAHEGKSPFTKMRARIKELEEQSEKASVSEMPALLKPSSAQEDRESEAMEQSSNPRGDKFYLVQTIVGYEQAQRCPKPDLSLISGRAKKLSKLTIPELETIERDLRAPFYTRREEESYLGAIYEGMGRRKPEWMAKEIKEAGGESMRDKRIVSYPLTVTGRIKQLDIDELLDKFVERIVFLEKRGDPISLAQANGIIWAGYQIDEAGLAMRMGGESSSEEPSQCEEVSEVAYPAQIYLERR